MYKTRKEEYVNLLNELRRLAQKANYSDKLLRIIIDRLLRKYSEERPPRFISKKVLEEAMKLNLKLVIKKHGDILPIRRQGLKIMFEHVEPINQLVTLVINDNGDMNALLDRNIVAIIMKSEDQLLDEKHRYNRGENPLETYASLGIELVEYELDG